MEHIGAQLKNIERNMEFKGADPVSRGGFVQVPVFIMRNPELSFGAKTVYALFISYGWNNDFCFPGQDTLAKHAGTTRVRITQLISELEKAGLVKVRRRGQGKTNFYTINFRVKQAKRARPEVNRLTSGSKPADPKM